MPVVARPAAGRSTGSQTRHVSPRASRRASRCASNCRRRSPPGSYELSADVRSSATARRRTIASPSTSCPRRTAAEHGPPRRSPLFDPKGETTNMLGTLGIQRATVEADADLSGYDMLDRRQGRADGRRAGAGHQPRARRPEGDRLRADRRGARRSGSASAWRSTACGRSSRACPITRCWPASRPSTCATGAARRRSFRRGLSTDAAALRPDGPVVRHPRDPRSGAAATAATSPRC